MSLTPMLTYDEPFQDELLTIHDFKIRSEKLAKLSKETEYQEGTRKLTFYTIFFVVWFLAAFLIFQSAYFWMLKRLSKSVYKRAYDYKIRDMGRMMEHS
ncbi:MAG: hypothetical protein AB8B55_00600 [Mariniblastus sp.]